jgi:hypothetical protein
LRKKKHGENEHVGCATCKKFGVKFHPKSEVGGFKYPYKSLFFKIKKSLKKEKRKNMAIILICFYCPTLPCYYLMLK